MYDTLHQFLKIHLILNLKDERNFMKFWTRIGNKKRYINDSDPTYSEGINFFKALVFFDANVLNKYTQSPSVYKINDRCIICKKEDGWILQSCYKSSNNEIYCYLYDLSLLPIEEKHYWRSFNLKNPTGQPNRLAIKSDCFCIFENSKKEDLVATLKRLYHVKIKIGDKYFRIWKPKEDYDATSIENCDVISMENYDAASIEKCDTMNIKKCDAMANEIVIPLVEEYKQYRDNFLLPLARLVIEGFIYKNLEIWSKELAIDINEQDKTLVILKKCLSHFCDEEQTKKITSPLRSLQKEKSAHASHGGKQPEQDVIQKSENMIEQITQSLVEIVKIIQNNTNNLQP